MRGIYTWLIPAVWIGWALYWYVAARTAKPVRRQESIASRLSHIVPLFLGILLLVSPQCAGAALGTRLLPRSALLFSLGTAGLLAGVLFAIAARRRLGGNWSSAVTLKQDHTLTRSGPYRWVRHPIYTGLLLALFASGVIALGEWRGWLRWRCSPWHFCARSKSRSDSCWHNSAMIMRGTAGRSPC